MISFFPSSPLIAQTKPTNPVVTKPSKPSVKPTKPPKVTDDDEAEEPEEPEEKDEIDEDDKVTGNVPPVDPSKVRRFPQTKPPTVKPNATVIPNTKPNAKVPKAPINDGVFPSTESDTDAVDPRELTERGDKEADFELLKGDLPCLDSTSSCIKLLSELAIANSETLKGLDAQITQNQDNAKAVAKAGEGNIFSLVQPFAPFLTGVPLLGIGSSVVSVLNNLAGNNRTDQTIAQNNATLQIRVSEIERSKLLIRDKIEDSVVQELVVFDNLRVQADIAVAIANRESSRFKLIEVGYRLGEGDTNSFIALQNGLDRTRVKVTSDKAALRIQAAKIKRIVLGDER